MEKEFIDSINKLIERDLAKLEEEIEMYPSEDQIWRIEGKIKNSAGNLCLHICGNLQHFIGSVLGNSGYIRKRDYEFEAKNVSIKLLKTEIKATKQVVKDSLEKLDPKRLIEEYPSKVIPMPMSTTLFLIHLTAHLDYHLGQINYHRRLLAS